MRRIVFVLLVIAVATFITISALAYSVPDGTIVYVTPTGKCYHKSNCSYLTTATSMTIKQAEAKGYRACSRCAPDKTTGYYISGESETSGSSSSSSSSSKNLVGLSKEKQEELAHKQLQDLVNQKLKEKDARDAARNAAKKAAETSEDNASVVSLTEDEEDISPVVSLTYVLVLIAGFSLIGFLRKALKKQRK